MSDYRDRARLHLNKIEDFAAWACANGYRRETAKGAYEVLRLRWVPETKPAHAPLSFYRHDAGDHATSWGAGSQLVQRWLRDREKIAA